MRARRPENSGLICQSESIGASSTSVVTSAVPVPKGEDDVQEAEVPAGVADTPSTGAAAAPATKKPKIRETSAESVREGCHGVWGT